MLVIVLLYVMYGLYVWLFVKMVLMMSFVYIFLSNVGDLVVSFGSLQFFVWFWVWLCEIVDLQFYYSVVMCYCCDVLLYLVDSVDVLFFVGGDDLDGMCYVFDLYIQGDWCFDMLFLYIECVIDLQFVFLCNEEIDMVIEYGCQFVFGEFGEDCMLFGSECDYVYVFLLFCWCGQLFYMLVELVLLCQFGDFVLLLLIQYVWFVCLMLCLNDGVLLQCFEQCLVCSGVMLLQCEWFVCCVVLQGQFVLWIVDMFVFKLSSVCIYFGCVFVKFGVVNWVGFFVWCVEEEVMLEDCGNQLLLLCCDFYCFFLLCVVFKMMIDSCCFCFQYLFLLMIGMCWMLWRYVMLNIEGMLVYVVVCMLIVVVLICVCW